MPYVGARHPAAQAEGTIRDGANCQTFAYAVLRHFGRHIPGYRSSELWEDRRDTFRVLSLAPLDLLLFNRTSDAFGAHVGVYAGDGNVLHLCRSVGRPAFWKLVRFAEHPKYAVLVGAKRARDYVGGQFVSRHETQGAKD